MSNFFINKKFKIIYSDTIDEYSKTIDKYSETINKYSENFQFVSNLMKICGCVFNNNAKITINQL